MKQKSKDSINIFYFCYQENNVSIIRMNTNWKESDLQWSRDRYQTNYVQFYCTKKKREELERKLKPFKISGK